MNCTSVFVRGAIGYPRFHDGNKIIVLFIYQQTQRAQVVQYPADVKWQYWKWFRFMSR